MEAGQLFETGPPAPRSNPQRPGDVVLYQPPRKRGARYDTEDNIRVRSKVQAHLETRVAKLQSEGRSARVAWRTARGLFVRDWEALCTAEGWPAPGSTSRQRTHSGRRTAQDRRVDAGRTALRQFLEGKDMPDWLLVGMEATVCSRTGQALPGAWYHGQRQLVRA